MTSPIISCMFPHTFWRFTETHLSLIAKSRRGLVWYYTHDRVKCFGGWNDILFVCVSVWFSYRGPRCWLIQSVFLGWCSAGLVLTSPAKPPDAAQCDLRADTVQREDGDIRALVWDTATRPDSTFSLTWWRFLWDRMRGSKNILWHVLPLKYYIQRITDP